MELTHIKTFIQIARSGSMTRASSELHRTQPALSAQLSKLEEELGENLFDRTAKGMELTNAGQVFLDYAEQALCRLEDGVVAVTKFRGLEHGSLIVGGGVTSTTYLLPKIFGRFARRYPNIRLYVREEASAEVVHDVLNGIIDLGIVTLPVSSNGNHNIEIEPWVDDELMLLVPPGHPFNERKSFRWKDLAGVPLVLFEVGSALRAQIDAKFNAIGIVPQIVMELRSIEAIKQMVIQGLGAAFVSQHCLSDDSPYVIPCKDGPIRRTLAAVYRSDITMNPATVAFLELMKP